MESVEDKDESRSEDDVSSELSDPKNLNEIVDNKESTIDNVLVNIEGLL